MASHQKRKYTQQARHQKDEVATGAHNEKEATHIFFINTTKSDKIDQLNAVAQEFHYPVIFLKVTALGKPSHSPSELEGSHKGNLEKKEQACKRHLSGFSYGQVEETVKSLGFSPSDLKNGKIRLYGIAEDSGFSFHRDVPQRRNAEGKTPDQQFVEMFLNTGPDGPYKTDMDKELVNTLKNKEFYHEGEPFPGVETVNVITAAGGVQNLLRLVSLTMKKFDMKLEPDGKSRGNTLQFRDDSILGAFRWEPDKKQPFGYFKKSDKCESFSVFDGRRFTGSKKSQRSDPNRTDRRDREQTTYRYSVRLAQAENGEYIPRDDMNKIFQPDARADAFKNIMAQYGVKPLDQERWTDHIGKIRHDLGHNLGSREFAVSLMPGDGKYQHKALRKQAKESLQSAGMLVHMPAHDGVTPDKQIERAWTNLQHMQDMLEHNDAFIFMPPGARHQVSATLEKTDKSRELEMLHAISYAMVHKALDPSGTDKLMMLLTEDPKEFDRIMRQVESMFNHGAMGDRPSESVKWADSPERAVELLKDHQRTYRPVNEHKSADAQKNAPDWKDLTGKYNVCVFLSASMQGVYEKKAEALGKRIQTSGMTLVYGAADRHMMGGVYHGALHAAKNLKEAPSIMGSTTPVIAATECEHGVKPKELADNWFYLAPDITKRKEFLFKNSHAFVLLEGGVGTLDELITYMHYKDIKSPLVEGKPMVVSESAYTKEPIFKNVLSYYLGQDITKMNDAQREAAFKKTGIMVMKPHTKLQEGSKKTLYEMDMDDVTEFLKKHRAEHHPALVPGSRENKGWLDRMQMRSGSFDMEAPGNFRS